MNNKGNFFTRSIRVKLIILFIIVALVPVIIIGYLSVSSAQEALKNAEFHKLESVGTLKTYEINNFLSEKFNELGVLTKSGDVNSAYQKLKDHYDNGGLLATGSYDVTSNQYKSIFKQIDPFFNVFLTAFHFHDIYFISLDQGHVMYSSLKKDDLGTNLQKGEYNNSGLAKAWSQVKSSKKPVMVDFSFYEPVGEAVAFIAAPVFDSDGKIIAVIALQLDTEKINSIMQEKTGMGETGETYLVGEDYLMRTDSRFSSESTILKRKVETESSKLGVQGKTGIHVTQDYRGVVVLSSYAPVGLKSKFGANFEWVILSEIDESEAFASSRSLTNEIIILSIIIALLVALVAYFFALYFTKPIKQLTVVAKAGALGDLNQRIENKLHDEIGQLSESFIKMQDNIRTKAEQAIQIANGNLTIEVNPLSDKDEMGKSFKLMVEKLRQHINEIIEVVSVLTSSNSQLMATIAQLSSTSNETATTVSEVTTTIEEVKQTAETSAQKAENVSGTAQKSVEISENGLRSTEDSLEGMNLIQDQVKQIAETIIKLSEQSQTIGEITNSVNDIAEQSNLLAVNASIEAAKAGEYGKGFGVVAQEIRALADQSKQSTRQIRDILADVQKAISSAVMATEQGGKAVDKGMMLANSAGDSISLLADNISEAAQSSLQIAASSKQQLTGMEQLAIAMDNIKTASLQNATGTKQTEEAVGNLKSIIENLKNLITNYKVK